MFDFPTTNVIGTTIAVPDGSLRTWDGTKWRWPIAGVSTGPGDGGGGSGGPYLPINGGTMLGPLYVTATGGTTPRSVQDRWGDVANVKDFGAQGDGVANDTLAIRAALHTGHTVYLPAGTYLVTDALNITTMGQRIYGDGMANTIISVPANFNMTARGVFDVEAHAGAGSFLSITTPGPWISDLTIQFAQVDTNVKANLIQFPPAIFVTSTLRWRIERVRMQAGWNGIYAYDDITGNATSGIHNGVGGGYMYDVFGGCLNTNIYIDGSSDSLHIDGCHFWPFGCTPNQQQIFTDPTQTVGIQIARADDFHISNIGAYIGLGIRLTQTANGGNYGEINNIDFDSFSGVEVISSNLVISNCLFLVGASRVGLNILGDATVTGSALTFADTSPGAAAVNCFPASGTSATLVLSGCTFGMAIGTNQYNTSNAININSNTSPGTSDVVISSCLFSVAPGVNMSSGIILAQSDSVNLTVTGCQITPKAVTDPAVPFVQITGNGLNHRIMSNSTPGWYNIVPVGCAYDYPNFVQLANSAVDLDSTPSPWSGFGIRNYIQAISQTNWPPAASGGPHITVLEVYTANPTWRVQQSFGVGADGLWYRWNLGSPTTWQPWQQIVTTYGGMRMHSNLDFDNAVGVRLFDTVGSATVSLLLSPSNILIFNGINASGGVRNIATMTQMSDTSTYDFSVPITYPGMLRLSDVDAAVDAALARHGLL